MANLVVEAVPPDVTGVASAINAIMRTIGGAIGAQVAAAIVSGALADGARYPAESGFTGAFAMSAAASAVALLVLLRDPLAQRRARAHAGDGGHRGDARVSADDKLSPEIIRVAIVVIVGAIMSILDTTIVNVALESLSHDLDAPLSTIQWVASGYLLALASVIPLTGWAAERFGARRVWMTMVSAFVVTSALCGAAWSAESLIAFRVLQGLAGGMIMPIGMITLAQAAGPQRIGRVMSVVGVPMLLAPVLGPVLGGVLVTHLSWRWIFFVNLPIGLVGLVLAAKLLPAGRAEGRDGAARGGWTGAACSCSPPASRSWSSASARSPPTAR